MELFQTIEFLFEIGTGISYLLLATLTYTKSKIKKIPSVFYLRLSFSFFGFLKICDGFATILNNIFLAQIYGICFFPFVFFLIIGINYTIRDNAISISLFITFGLGILLIYISLQPNIAKIILKAGQERIEMNEFLNLLIYILAIIGALYTFYWGFKTWLNAPFYIKREATIFFIGNFIATVVTMFIQSLMIILPIMILIYNITVSIGLIICMYAIFKEPKLLYILPFTIYRIVVKDQNGNALYDHDWSESDVKEMIFTGFLNAVQIMSEEIMKIGGLLDINLHKGILILNESKYITVGLVSSKSSKLLRNSVTKFSNDFEEKFERILKKKCIDMTEYETAYELIEKHFSNFPYRISKEKKHPLTLSYKQKKLPLEKEKNLKNIIKNEEEYEFVKTEMSKSPISLSSGFFDLYNELEDQIDEIESKKVDEGKEE